MDNSGFVGGSKGVLKENRRAGNGLTCLYDSNKWEFNRWNRDTDRKNWKVYRASQYRKQVPTVKALALIEVDWS